MIRTVAILSLVALAVVSCAGGPVTEATIRAAFRREEASSRWSRVWRRKRKRHLEDYQANQDDYYAAADDDQAVATDDGNNDDDSSKKSSGNIADEKCSEFLVSFLEGTTDAHDTCEGIMNAYTAAGA